MRLLKRLMRRFMFLTLVVLLAGWPAARSTAQAGSPAATGQACDRACQQALFDQAEREDISSRPKPSQSKDCPIFDGHDRIDPLFDICAKLKYVRSLPAGTGTRFSCPSDLRGLLGMKLERIRAMWGEPDFVDDGKSGIGSRPDPRWTYFIGSPVPLAFGGGFPQLSLHYDDKGYVTDVDCSYAR